MLKAQISSPTLRVTANSPKALGNAPTLRVTANSPKATGPHSSSTIAFPSPGSAILTCPSSLVMTTQDTSSSHISVDQDQSQDLWRGLFIRVIDLLAHGQPASDSVTTWSIPLQKCLSQTGWPTRACSTALKSTLIWTPPLKESHGRRKNSYSPQGLSGSDNVGERKMGFLPASIWLYTCQNWGLAHIAPTELNGDLNLDLTQSKALFSPLRNAAKGRQHALPDKRYSVLRYLSPPTTAGAGTGSTTAMPTKTGQMTRAQFKKGLTYLYATFTQLLPLFSPKQPPSLFKALKTYHTNNHSFIPNYGQIKVNLTWNEEYSLCGLLCHTLYIPTASNSLLQTPSHNCSLSARIT